MQRFFQRAAVSAVAIILGVAGYNAFASTAVVTPPNTTACKNLTTFNTISAAVTAVTSGSTIYVCPGTYAEQVVINKKLTLTGVSANGSSGSPASGANNPTVISPTNGVVVNAFNLRTSFPTAAQILVATPSGATAPIVVNINNLTIDGSNNQLSSCATNLVGIYYQNASGTVDHVTARFQELPPADFGCQDGLAIYTQAGYGATFASSVTIENSNVHDYDKNGITVDGDQMSATVTGNYVVGVGPTSLIAQNGIEFARGANGKVTNNIVTDDVYVNAPDCGSSCTSASGILLYDTGGISGSPLTVSGNSVSNTQGAIVAFTDGLFANADYNTITSNKITSSIAAGTFLIDGIDLCSNNNIASSNTVMYSSGSGVHIDSQCGSTGNGTTVMNNTINEACAGVLTGSFTDNTVTGNITYNVAQTVQAGDSCAGSGTAGARRNIRLKPQPSR